MRHNEEIFADIDEFRMLSGDGRLSLRGGGVIS
jgi:hypothetical protein